MKKTVDKNVLNTIKQHLENLKGAYQENKEVTTAMIDEMKEVRELFKVLEQPTIVKSIRLVYEHIENHENLDGLSYWETEEIELDDENSSFEYYIGLLTNPTNKYNREEIKELNILLKEFDA